ncbi:MAG: anthranilate synthase component I family protein [Crocinitomicaceae bacterium]
MNIYTHKQQLLCDTQTPISTFLSLRDHFANVSLFESSDYTSKANAHSFIGVNTIVSIQVNNGEMEARLNGKIHSKSLISSSEDLTRLKDSFEFVNDSERHHNGFFGVIGYDAIPLFEDIQIDNEQDELPEVFLAAYEFVLVFDHFHNQLTILNNSFTNKENRLPIILRSINKSFSNAGEFKTIGELKSSETDETFKEKVKLAKEHILRGDVFQLVLSRQFSQQFEGDDFAFYRQLRTLNPSPYMFYFDLEKAKLIGASPEAQIKIENGIAEIHPIAGTVRKSENFQENLSNIEALKVDEKENAEHIMLVDLARNDLNQTCSKVAVEKLKEVQSFSHVIHLVSKVTGRIQEASSLQIFGGSFPAGTLSGAPKYRAMELINKYENKPRKYYGGAIGLLAANGDVNMAIVIRTALSHKGELKYQAGAGIVYDSTEEGECQEVYNKINAVQTAIKNANQS